jgi:hypothetical protein
MKDNKLTGIDRPTRSWRGGGFSGRGLELQNCARLWRQFARMLGSILALAVCCAPALAQQLTPIAGNHLNYIPFTVELPKKDASGGGPSMIFPKPGWQTGMGVPDDGARDVPDVAIGANGVEKPGFFVAAQTGPCSAASAGPTFPVVGGTSPSPSPTASSKQIIPQEGINVTNGNGGIIELTRLPATLGTVTIQY